LRIDLKNVPRFIYAAMRLHNFLIDEQQLGFDDDNNETQHVLQVLSDKEILVQRCNYDAMIPPVENMQWRHKVRESIVNKIKSDGLQRPLYNLQRNVE
jgi:ppGpp synthetase/RelA/SpoT-type nucleotidyltranferase